MGVRRFVVSPQGRAVEHHSEGLLAVEGRVQGHPASPLVDSSSYCS